MTEQQLTDTINNATFTAPPQNLDWSAIEQGGNRLRRRRRVGRLSSTALAITAIAAVGAIAVPLTHSGRPATVLSTGSTGVGPAYQTAASTGPSGAASLDPGLDTVTLPNPAPGFPTRRGTNSDRVFNTSFINGPSAPAKTFMVDSDPYTSATSATVTDEATVYVARAGASGEAAVGKDAGYPVTGSTIARGCSATVTTENTPGPQVGVFVTVGGLTISAYGSTFDAAGATGSAQDAQHLVPGLITLINSLEGVPSGSCG